jgi:demethylmenaquinone methyltransferase/2-methoxy-6-polyprenyl-1,4-benzoquinol methylase
MPITAQKQAPLAGTRPEGTRDEREAAAHVREMFTDIAPGYDFLNHLLSFSLDHLWRRRTAKRFTDILRRPDARVLDICCGTGDLAFALARERLRVGGRTETVPSPIFGSDFVEGMVERAQKKAQDGKQAAIFAAADALNLPFSDASFDLVTTAFGFRNLADYEHGLLEIARVLKPGGEIGILEFTEPHSGPLAAVFRFYFQHVLPRIGGVVSGNSEAYAYLPGSVSKFPAPAALASLMEKTGFFDVRFTAWNFGSVILHTGCRASTRD